MKEHFRGWDILGTLTDNIKYSVRRFSLRKSASRNHSKSSNVAQQISDLGLDDEVGRKRLAEIITTNILESFDTDIGDVTTFPFHKHLANIIYNFLEYEKFVVLNNNTTSNNKLTQSEIWRAEDRMSDVANILENFDKVTCDIAQMFRHFVTPIIEDNPSLLTEQSDDHDEMNLTASKPTRNLSTETLTFTAPLPSLINDLPKLIERMVRLPFVPEFDDLGITAQMRERLGYNLVVASGGNPADPGASNRALRFPTKTPSMPPDQLIQLYLEGTPLMGLFDYSVPITLPQPTRFEHHHIVAGSGHGKTQMLQHLLLRDMDKVSRGEASVVVLDSQGDLINNISNLAMFASNGPLADRLVLIDPTDVEYPVALNLFDVNMQRINSLSQLDRERMTNGILELYDFVLGSLLAAEMTQKQSVIFRYITRLLLHIPNATIHTLRELLEDDGAAKYQKHIDKLEGTAKAFFETEFNSREFVATKRQVVRRLWGILENQTFERMFSHPTNKLDLFSEMNEGKVILINTSKDLLKENGTEIFGRFFIAMIAQAAQERSVIDEDKRKPTYVYVDEASDYFDRNIGLILSQARKYKVGMILAHQYMGQLENKLQEGLFANTSIKFAGGVSSKDARSLAQEMRCDSALIENQAKFSFAAHITGTTKSGVSISIKPGQMESLPTLSEQEKQTQRETMRKRYAVHYSVTSGSGQYEDVADPGSDTPSSNNESDSQPDPFNDDPKEW